MSEEAIIQNNQFGHRSDLLVCLQRECSCLLDTLELLYADRVSLSRPEVSELYASLRYGGVSSRQLNAAIKKVCSSPEGAEESGISKNELVLLLPELDRRYFIVQGAQWDFQFLDRHWKGEISEKDALFLFKAVHGNHFVMHSWEVFLGGRAERGSKVTWEEIEVPLCDIPDHQEFNLLKEKEAKAKEERQIREKELAQKRKERMVKEREKQLREQRAREQQQLREEQLAKKREEQLVKEREEQLAREREEEQARKREEELAREGPISHEATEEEDKLTTAVATPSELTPAHDDRSADSSVSKETEHLNNGRGSGKEERVEEEEKHRQLRGRLERAVQSKDVAELEPAVEVVKKEKVPNCSELLDKAEKLLKKLYATKNLHDATVARKLAALEKAIDEVKKGGWEKDLRREMQEANTLLEKLRRLEQRKKAVLELSQRVIAELKSYSNPPPQVHQVMRATFLLLGNSEQETKSWQATQILIGKTGKGSLKRRVAECSAEAISLPVAERASAMLQQFDSITIQDTSLGCATFHAWAEGIIDEVQER